jgi:tetratricopeptide (TPR) repeat protein
MDWTTVLQSLQSDFIKRLKSGCLLCSEIEGQYSELTIICGERLKQLREFCWQMAEKYKRTSPVRDVFINNLKGKLGEEVVKERLADLITEIDYEKRFGGDGKIDFTLNSDPAIGIEVKSRHGIIDKIRWSISAEEVQKNAVVVCILIQEEVHEAQPEYHLFLAGFLPTEMIKLRTGKISFGIEQLLYGGGLRSYLEQLQSPPSYNSSHYNSLRQKPPVYAYKPKPQVITHKSAKNQVTKSYLSNDEDEVLQYSDEELNQLYIKLGDECLTKKKYDAAMTNYNAALQVKNNNFQTYYKRGLARYNLGDFEGAIVDYNQAINIHPHYAQAFNKSGLARYQLGDCEGAIADFTQAIRINPNYAVAYKNRAYTRYHLGDYQGAIEDYTQALIINPQDDYPETNIAKPSYLPNNQPNLSQAINTHPHQKYIDSQNGNPPLQLIEFLHQINEINGNDASAYKHRASFRYDLGDYKGAIEDYTQVITIKPDDANAYYNRGNARADLGDCQGAIADYTQAININPNDAQAYYNRGNVLAELGDKQGAIADFQKACELYRRAGKLAEHKKVRESILELEIEESLDILNF